MTPEKFTACKRCSEARMLDCHGICSLCDHICARLSIMFAPNPCGEIPLPNCANCNDSGEFSTDLGHGCKTIPIPCNRCSAGDKKQTEYFTPGMHQGSGRFIPFPIQAGSGDMKDLLDTPYPLIGIDEAQFKMEHQAEFINDTKATIQAGALVPMEDLKIIVAKPHMKTCSSCVLQSHTNVCKLVPGSDVLVCDDCFGSFIQWYGVRPGLPSIAKMERAFTNWRIHETDNPPNIQVGAVDPLMAEKSIPCYRSGCNNESDMFSSGTATCDSCFVDYMRDEGRKIPRVLNFKAWSHLNSIHSCFDLAKPVSVCPGHEFLLYDDLLFKPSFGENFRHNGLEYVVMDAGFSHGVIVVQTYGVFDMPEKKDPDCGVDDTFRCGRCNYNIGGDMRRSQFVNCYSIVMECKDCNETYDFGVGSERDSTSWFQRISKDAF